MQLTDDRHPAGLEATFLANKARLVRFLALRGAGDNAEDLAQDLWFKLQSRPTGPLANPESYLFRAAHNLMIDWYRSESHRVCREEAWVDASSATLREADCAPDAERNVISRSLLNRMVAEIDALGEPTSSIFKQFRIEGCPQKDIAADFGVSLTTVEKHLQKAYRAVAAVRHSLGETV